MYDSKFDTITHIERVSDLLMAFATELRSRGAIHDDSKLSYPEKDGFDEATPKLKALTYNSPEYLESLALLGETLKHHYSQNSHHPEYYAFDASGELVKEDLTSGEAIARMSLFDIVEMLIDWLAACERHENGNIRTSIDQNTTRFGLDWQLRSIFQNTINEMERKLWKSKAIQ